MSTTTLSPADLMAFAAAAPADHTDVGFVPEASWTRDAALKLTEGVVTPADERRAWRVMWAPFGRRPQYDAAAYDETHDLASTLVFLAGFEDPEQPDDLGTPCTEDLLSLLQLALLRSRPLRDLMGEMLEARGNRRLDA